jgi:beta-phosphoglucomutase-like phosphatase (HAD superfamily)
MSMVRKPPAPARRRRSPRHRDPAPAVVPPAPPTPPVDLDALRSRWRTAFTAAQNAVHAADRYLGGAAVAEHRLRLAAEYEPTVRLLRELAVDEGIPLLLAQPFAPPGEARRLLGLPRGVTACVFNLDGVLVGSAALHRAAWTRTFDELISQRSELAGDRFVPHFDPQVDYPAHVHARPRLEGVRTFLASRGIRLPEGSPDDPPGTESVNGLANRKSELLVRLLDERGVDAFEGSRRYLELARDAGIRSAVVSASAHTDEILERSGLAGLVDAKVDAAVIVAEHLRGRPAPDRILAACSRLGVEPALAALFETGIAGIAAGRTAGFRVVIGVDRSDDAAHAAALRTEGADLVVPGLDELVERELPAARR